MFKMPKKIEYAMPEKIGNPELFAGRKEEFDYFLGDWYNYMEGNFAPNQAILSRRKKGKSAFMQRLFNILWSAGAEKKEGEFDVSVNRPDRTVKITREFSRAYNHGGCPSGLFYHCSPKFYLKDQIHDTMDCGFYFF